jgi:hypothetical protein
MAGCGYVCPICEGTGFIDGKECDYCSIPVKEKEANVKNADMEEWINKVHEGPCCSDLGK